MTLDDIANFCELKDCTVALGSPVIGFIQVDGNGVQSKFNNYRRFLAHNELSRLPSPRKVLEQATVFRVHRQSGTETFDRDRFEAQLKQFMEKVGL